MTTTTIRTSSENYFGKIQEFLTSKRISSIPTFNNGVYSITFFNLTTSETNSLIQKMTKHFHLSPITQPEPLALAA
ncbi:MAG: hypothetical protein IKW78_02385 [Prevotella sp.]|nr:hypothetical protein [Prevotella sp.]